ncbi:SSU ribosomal protein S2p (SAe) [Vibrio crassostreae]|nr:SSU ribosomal protein S2p (SAe) [Vibrio crassostreae]
MAKDNYPFPHSRSMYWSDPSTTTTYEEAVAMFEAQTDVQKKMMKNPIVAPKTQTLIDQKQVQAETVAKMRQETASFAPSSSPSPSLGSMPTSSPLASPELNALSEIPTEVCLDNVFMLGWYQVEETGQIDLMWDELFTPETSQKTINFIKGQNRHLNSYVRQGEIVVLPTMKPVEEKDKQALKDLKEDAQAASAELAKLSNEAAATVHRHFDLFSYQLEKRIREDGLPSDYYAQVSTGVGATAAIVEQNLKNIQNVVLEINDLYASQVAMASRTGGMNYGSFIAERATLFQKLDGSFAMLSKRSVQIPAYRQVKRNLKLSTKSVIHHADEILKSGFVPNLGKRTANIAKGISAARGLGYIGLGIGVASGVDSIYEACKVDGSGECGKTTTREVFGFIGGWLGGAKGGSIGAGFAVGSVLLVVGVTASAPILALAAIGGAVVGGSVGGIAGSSVGKSAGDLIYENTMVLYEWSSDFL